MAFVFVEISEASILIIQCLPWDQEPLVDGQQTNVILLMCETRFFISDCSLNYSLISLMNDFKKSISLWTTSTQCLTDAIKSTSVLGSSVRFPNKKIQKAKSISFGEIRMHWSGGLIHLISDDKSNPLYFQEANCNNSSVSSTIALALKSIINWSSVIFCLFQVFQEHYAILH